MATEQATLKISADLTRLLDQLERAGLLTGELEQAAQDYRKAAGSGFEEAAKDAATLNREIKQMKGYLKEVEAEERRLDKERAAGRKVNETTYKRVKGDVVAYRNELEKLQGQLRKVQTETTMAGTAADKTWSRIQSYLGAAAIGYAGKQLIDLAVSLDVVNAKADIVFGEYAGELDKVAAKTSKTLGLSNAQYKKAAAAIGDLLVPMKFTRKEAFTLSTGLMSLSGALSEWTGGKYNAVEVSNIFVKAMLGEREQLKELGIKIDEMDVKNALLAKGQGNLTGEYLKQAEAIATMELISARSIDAQVKFGESSESLRRKAAELRANFQELKDGLALQLTPTFNTLFAFINNNLSTIVKFAKAIGVLTLSLITYKKTVEIATWVTKALNLSMAATPWGLVMAAISLVAGAIMAFKMKTDLATESQDKFNKTAEELEAERFQDNIDQMVGAYRDFGLSVEEANKKTKESLASLTADQLARVREMVEKNLVEMQTALKKNEEIFANATGAAKETSRQIVEYNKQGVDALNDILQETIVLLGKVEAPQIDVTKWSLEEIENKLKELNSIQESLLTEEQKKLKKALENELKIRMDALNRARELYKISKMDYRALVDEINKLEEMRTDLLTREERERLAILQKELSARKARHEDDKLFYEDLQKTIKKLTPEIVTQASEMEAWSAAIDSATGSLMLLNDEMKKSYEIGDKEPPPLLDPARAEQAAKSIEDYQRQYQAQVEWNNANPFWSHLGFEDDETVNAFKDNVGMLIDSIGNLMQAQIDAKDATIQLYTDQIEETMQLMEQEAEFRAAGLANDYELQKQNYEKLKAARDQELKEKEKWVRAQQIMNSLLQASELATAAAKVLSSEASKGLIGVIVGIGALALLLSVFSAFVGDSKAAAAGTLEMGKGGKLKGPSHSEGGMPIVGSNQVVEGDEFLVNKRSTAKYEPLLQAINKDSPQAIKIALAKQRLADTFVNVAPTNIDESQKLQKIIDLLSNDQQTVVGPGWILEKGKGYTKKTYLN